MEEPRRVKVNRVQVNGILYVKNSKGFLWKEKKNKEGKSFAVGGPVAYHRKVGNTHLIFKKRVNLVYKTTQGKHIEITSSLDTLEDLFTTYQHSNKHRLMMVYGISKGIINEVTNIENPTVNEAYKLVRAVRASVVITSILANTELPTAFITCSVCKKEDINSTFKKCGCCKRVYYCSSDCNKVAWAEHKKVCRAMMCCENWL